MAPGRRAGGTGAARRPTRLCPRHDVCAHVTTRHGRTRGATAERVRRERADTRVAHRRAEVLPRRGVGHAGVRVAMQLSVSGRYDEWRLPVPRGSMQEVAGQPSRLVSARVFLPFCEVARRAGTVILLAFCEVAQQSGSGTCRTGRRDSCTIRCGFASTLGEPSSPSSNLRLARARRPSEPRADRSTSELRHVASRRNAGSA